MLGMAMLPAGATAAPAPAPACKGRDLLPELSKADAEAGRRIEVAAAAIPNGEAILWRIARPGVRPSHLFGTIHVSDERATRLSPAVSRALDGADRVALEVADLSPAAMSRAIASLIPQVIFVDGRSLSTLLTPEELAVASRAASRAGLPRELFAVARPWLVTMMMAITDCERARLSSGKLPLDLQLAARARDRSIPLVGLETLEGQLAAMASVPEADQLTVLKASLKLERQSEHAIETILARYLAREVSKVWPMQQELWHKAGFAPKAFDTLRHHLITVRNKRMLDAALPLVAEGNAFIAVGALHLVGSDGLVALLRAAGYEVTAVE
jgi:hypothetical protein